MVLQAALCYAWKQDNQGPHAGAEALAIFKGVERIYPNASVHPSDAFDDFVTAVLPFSTALPSLDREIGDSWIHGASADPKKMATFRALSRVRARCSKHGSGCNDLPHGSPSLMAFDRLLIKARDTILTHGRSRWKYTHAHAGTRTRARVKHTQCWLTVLITPPRFRPL